MSDKAAVLPEDTAGLVALTQYLTHCQDVRMLELRKMIRIAAANLCFLVKKNKSNLRISLSFVCLSGHPRNFPGRGRAAKRTRVSLAARHGGRIQYQQAAPCA